MSIKKNEVLQESLELKKIKREIWWTETKIDWLKLVSTSHVAVTFMYYLPAAVLFALYLLIYKFFISGSEFKKMLGIILGVILFFICWYWTHLLDKQAAKKLKQLNERLDGLYKEKRNASDLLKVKEKLNLN